MTTSRGTRRTRHPRERGKTHAATSALQLNKAYAADGKLSGKMTDAAENRRRAMRATRELTHVATSLASEAANLARAFESSGGLEASIAASHASIRAAQSAFEADEVARAPDPSLDDMLAHAERAVEAAEQALGSARRALEHMRHGVAARQTSGTT